MFLHQVLTPFHLRERGNVNNANYFLKLNSLSHHTITLHDHVAIMATFCLKKTLSRSWAEANRVLAPVISSFRTRLQRLKCRHINGVLLIPFPEIYERR